MLEPGRKFVQGNGRYRYGFNGKELDKETTGISTYDYGFRIYNPALGRFLSVDPLTISYPELSPYQYAENSPILFIDLDGLEKALPWYLRENKFGGKPVLTLGLGNISRAQRIESYQNKNVATKVGTFAWNVIASAWNGIADTWNDGMGGKTGSDMLIESIQSIEKVKVEDFKRVETWENIGGLILTAYATKRITKSFGAAVGAAEARVGVNRINFAKDFYVKQGFTEAKALEHIEGIDITKKVFTTTLKKGTVIQQWVGEKGVGSYFATAENGATQNLGLNDYNKRTLKQFTVTSDIEVLQSTAGEYKGATGGGTQFFSTELKSNIAPVKTP
jgi:RHS repeat-associated protein